MKYLSGKENILADALSRAHLNETTEDIPEEELAAQVHMIYANAAATKTKLDEIKAETQKDATLMTIHRFIMNGWPKRREDVPDEIKPYWSYKEEMFVINGVMFKGERLIIPTSMRKDVLKLLHQSHMGIEKTKWRARATIFWPSINTQIEDMIKSCDICQHNKKAQQKETMITTEVLDYPFQMIRTDLFHWNGQDFLLVLDYYNQYWDIERLYNTESETVIKKLNTCSQDLEFQKSSEAIMDHNTHQSLFVNSQRIGE